MPDALVSICMSAYNAEEHLAIALDSALAQTWENLEIIVVDHGSTDETRPLRTVMQRSTTRRRSSIKRIKDTWPG